MNDKYIEISKLISLLDPEEDAILIHRKIKTIVELFQQLITDDEALQDLMNYLNTCAINDSKFAVNFAYLVSSKVFDTFNTNQLDVRRKMLNILQYNFINIQLYKENIQQFYNSITLLGEYFNRARLSDGKPIKILGKSLFNLLTDELEYQITEHSKNNQLIFDVDFAHLILNQITLNGNLGKKEHSVDIDKLLFAIRKTLLNIVNIPVTGKAFLLMSLDLYYRNFTTLGDDLEILYAKFLIDNHNKKKNENTEKKVATVVTTESDHIISENVVNKKQLNQKNATNDQKNVLNNKAKKKNACDVKNGVKGDNKSRKAIKSDDIVVSNDKSVQKNATTGVNNGETCANGTVSATTNIKPYFKEENVENLTWDALNLDEEKSPKVNPYSESFLNFLGKQ